MNDLGVLVKEVEARDRRAALELLLLHVAAEDRAAQIDAILAGAAGGQFRLDGLLAAYREERLVGAAFVEVQAGRMAGLWLPRAAPDAPPGVLDALFDEALRRLRAQGVVLAQMLLAECGEAESLSLRKWGFVHLADLLYLVCRDDVFPEALPLSSLEFESFQPADHARMARIVEATYRGTRDCPALDGLRPIDDVLAGYRATGVYDPSRWLLVRHEGRDVGCLLLADHPQQDNYELVYMGVVPEDRGAGWGIEIARHAQWLTRQAGRKRLVLAVDADNAPAIRMYAAVGFQAWDRRMVFVRRFD